MEAKRSKCCRREGCWVGLGWVECNLTHKVNVKPEKQTIGFGNVELVGDPENKVFTGRTEIKVKMEWLKMNSR